MVVDGDGGGAFYRGGTKTGVGYPSATGGSIAGMGIYSGYAFDASRSWTGATSSTGSNSKHNTIPAYIVCYAYKRAT